MGNTMGGHMSNRSTSITMLLIGQSGDHLPGQCRLSDLRRTPAERSINGSLLNMTRLTHDIPLP